MYSIFATDEEGSFFIASRESVLLALAKANEFIADYTGDDTTSRVTEVKIIRERDWKVVLHKEF